MYLTKRQKEIYQYLKEHIQTMGYAPSIMEICAEFNLSSPATVHKHLTHIEEKGLIRREQNLSRAIELVEEEMAAFPEFQLLGHIMAGQPIEFTEAGGVSDAEVIAQRREQCWRDTLAALSLRRRDGGLSQCVPGRTFRALTLPFDAVGAAVRTYVGRFRSRHK